jgi:DNA-binding CsgD family transcriptional regulator
MLVDWMLAISSACELYSRARAVHIPLKRGVRSWLTRVTLGDVRAAFNLLGECRELAYDPGLWLRHALEGLRKLVGARVVMGGEAHWDRPCGPITPFHHVLVGIPKAVEGNFIGRLREGGLNADVISARLKALPQPEMTRTRQQLVSDQAWYRSVQCEGLHRPAGIDHCIASLFELSRGRALLLGIHRAAKEPDFSTRELNLVHLFQTELGRLIGAVLVSADDAFSPSRLAPRVRETLSCLLEGDGEKQAASRMGLSRETVHQYVKALYRHYQVASRPELLVRVLGRPWRHQ